MRDEWHYQAFGREFGPVPFEMIAELAQGGQIGPEDLLRRDQEEWVAAGTIEGLFAGTESVPPSDVADDPSIVRDLSDLEFTFTESHTPAPPTRDSAGRSAPLARTWVAPLPVERPQLAPLPSAVPATEPRIDDPPDRTSHQTEQDASLLRSTERLEQTAAPSSTAGAVSPAGRSFDNRSQSWYARSLGLELGPMSFADLVALAANGELSESDRIRSGHDEAWRAPDSISELAETLRQSTPMVAPTAKPAPKSSRRTSTASRPPAPESASMIPPATEALLPASEAPEPMPEERTVEPAEVPVAPSASQDDEGGMSGAGGASPPKDVSQLIRAAQAAAAVSRKAKEPEPKKSKSRRTSKSSDEKAIAPRALAGLVLILALLLGWRYMPSFGSDRKTYEQFAAVYEEVKTLRQKQASDDEWTQLTNRVKIEIMPIVAELRKTAGSKKPIKQNLLWAGRDCLLPMLGSARKLESKDEKDFAMYLGNARKLLDGEPLSDKPANSDSE